MFAHIAFCIHALLHTKNVIYTGTYVLVLGIDFATSVSAHSSKISMVD